LDKVVALAILMPIVASMGGVAGSQTLTVVIRGMALGQIERGNLNWLLSKEFAVGALNGLLYALIVGCVVSLWFQDATMALIIGLGYGYQLDGGGFIRHITTRVTQISKN
jgi:magnesium transporter